VLLKKLLPKLTYAHVAAILVAFFPRQISEKNLPERNPVAVGT
jgi:hypothetical protein